MKTTDKTALFDDRVHAMACAVAGHTGYSAADGSMPSVIAQQSIKLVLAVDAALLKARQASLTLDDVRDIATAAVETKLDEGTLHVTLDAGTYVIGHAQSATWAPAVRERVAAAVKEATGLPASVT